MTVTPSEMARSELVDRILDEVDSQLFLEEYVTLPSGRQLTAHGRNAVRAVIEDAIEQACSDACEQMELEMGEVEA